MKRFVGDLSRADAAVLERHAEGCSRILEFGAGGSTQIMAQSLSVSGVMISVETDLSWRDRTARRLVQLGVANRCTFIDYAAFERGEAGSSFDLIFVDGVDHLRRSFALTSWRLLNVGGVMCFHDTRRENDIENVLALVRAHFNEVSEVHVNARPTEQERSSNVTIIRKKTYEPYENWNVVENRSREDIGYGETDPWHVPR